MAFRFALVGFILEKTVERLLDMVVAFEARNAVEAGIVVNDVVELFLIFILITMPV